VKVFPRLGETAHTIDVPNLLEEQSDSPAPRDWRGESQPDLASGPPRFFVLRDDSVRIRLKISPFWDVAVIGDTLPGVRPKANVPSGSQTPHGRRQRQPACIGRHAAPLGGKAGEEFVG